MPLQRQIPKRGFRSHRTLTYEVVNLRDLNLFEAGSLVDDSALREKGILTKRRPVKILAKGTLSKPLTVRAAAFSTTAREAIESAGGKAEVVNSVR